MLLALASLFASAHVPTYAGEVNVDNCYAPSHLKMNLSQVLYLKGTGGMEVHLKDSTYKGQAWYGTEDIDIEFDVVFRDRIVDENGNWDQDIKIYVGCGGCAQSTGAAFDAPISESQKTNMVWQPMSLEPFTQTRYYSAFNEEDRRMNTEDVVNLGLDWATDCGDHFTIRMIDENTYRNTYNPIRWGAVLGLGESFNADELFLFPLYILNNHGAAWSDKVTWPGTLLLAPVIIYLWRIFARLLRWRIGTPKPSVDAKARCRLGILDVSRRTWTVTLTNGTSRIYFRKYVFRDWLYYFALIGFLWGFLEMLWHVFLAHEGVPWDQSKDGPWWGFVVAFSSQIVPLWLLCIIWNGIRFRNVLRRTHELYTPWSESTLLPVRCMTQSCCLKCCARKVKPAEPKETLRPDPPVYCVRCWACSSSPSWAGVEIFTGFSFFFWLGAGFWISPICVMTAGFWRLYKEFYLEEHVDVTEAWTWADVTGNKDAKSKPPSFRNCWRCWERGVARVAPADAAPLATAQPQDISPELRSLLEKHTDLLPPLFVTL